MSTTTKKSTTAKSDKPKSASAPKATTAETIAAPISAPAPPGLNDTGRADGAPVLGHFAEVTEGENKGFFGVLQEVQGDTAVLQGHNNPLQRVTAPLADVIKQELQRG